MLAWGCTCGRLSDPDDRFCRACGGPQAQGEPIETEAQKKVFLARAERNDATALRGVRKVMRAGEASYRSTADELYRHATADYAKFDGWFGDWLRGTGGADPYGGVQDSGYGLDDWEDWGD